MKITLNKELYDKKAIEVALNDFKHVCDGKIIDDSIQIELQPKQDVKFIEHEFCNYVLGIMVNENEY